MILQEQVLKENLISEILIQSMDIFTAGKLFKSKFYKYLKIKKKDAAVP